MLLLGRRLLSGERFREFIDGDEMKILLLLTIVLFCCSTVWPTTVKLRIDTGQPVRTMLGGMGASWHAIETPIPDAKGGSGWGAYPPAEDEAAWQSVYRHADWLGLNWCRVELEQRMYEPERQRFDWDNPEMRILYRILDWAEARHVHVFLQQMWGNTTWNAYPELRDDPEKRVKSAPLSVDDFANGYAELVHHLVKVKGYTCIRWLSLNNEPGQDFSWWQGPDLKPLSATPDFKAARAALDRSGIAVPISGPDWTDLPPLEPSKIDFDLYIGAYDVHSYWCDFDKPGPPGEFSMSTSIARIGDWVGWAHQRGKPFFLSEIGTMAYGWQGTDPGPGSYESSLKNASLVVRSINAAVDAFNRWSFLNRGDLDGQWQLLDTWDVKAGRMMSEFKPHPNAYFMWALLNRYVALNSQVLQVRAEGGDVDGLQRLVAAGLRSPKGELTVLVVNEGTQDMAGTLEFENVTRSVKLYRYRVTPSMRDRNDIELKPEASFAIRAGRPTLKDNLPARSITVYSTYKLGPTSKGVQVE
jgi:hypothetical protein